MPGTSRNQSHAACHNCVFNLSKGKHALPLSNVNQFFFSRMFMDRDAIARYDIFRQERERVNARISLIYLEEDATSAWPDEIDLAFIWAQHEIGLGIGRSKSRH